MATAEVLPIEITAEDGTRAAWQTLKRSIQEVQDAMRVLNAGLSGMNSMTTQGIGAMTQLGRAVALLRSPYVLLGAAVAAVGYETYRSFQRVAALKTGIDDIGVSVDAITSLEAGFKKVGGNVDVAISALKSLRREMDIAGRGDDNFLDKLFAANGRSLRDASGHLKPLQTIYADVNELIRNAATETDRLDIATRVYGSEAAPTMVKAILDGSDALQKVNADSAVLSAIIDQQKTMDRVWREMTNAPDGLIGKLRNGLLPIIEHINSTAIWWAAKFGSKEAQLTLAMPGSARMWDTTSQRAIDEHYNSIFRRGHATNFPSDKSGAPNSVDTGFERAMYTVSKHVAVMEADAKAVGLTAGEHEALRVQAQLTEAAIRANIPIAGETAENFTLLAQRARMAADNLAFLKLKNDVLFERAQIGRTSLEQQIFSRLRSSGIDPTSEQGMILAQEMRINDALRETKDLAADALKGFIADLRAGKTAGEAFANVLDRLATKLIDKSIESLLSAVFGRSSGSSGIIQTIISSIFGSAEGNVLSAGRLVPFARGGVVDAPTLFPMANGIGLMGEAGAEAIMPLARGSDGKLGVRASGGGGVNVVINSSPTFYNADPASEARMRAFSIEAARQAVKEAKLGIAKANLGYALG